MIKSFRDTMRKGYNSVAKLEAKDVKPTQFKMNMTDLGKMHELRAWYLENSPNQSKRFQYLKEIEVLHDEINYMNHINYQKRMVWLAIGVLGYYFLWIEPDTDKYEFSEEYDMKQFTRSFVNLEDGGFEVTV